MKIAAGIEYCGTRYSGWQCQKDVPNIQEHVEQAVSKVANHPVRVICAGRTDTGVHALNQVIHFETSAQRKLHSWILGSNVNMSADVSMIWARQVEDDFHARYSATGRTYRYIILNRAARPGFNNGLVTWEYRPLDEERMTAAAAHLAGEHDFTSFRSAACQAKNPVRVVRRCEVYRQHDYVILEIAANAFLHHMVRNIAGVLMAIGMRKEDPDWVKDILRARNRKAGGVTAPADGLYLMNVDYPDKYGLPVPVVTDLPML